MFRAVLLLQEIPASPFRVKVEPSHDASKVKAEGPGLSKTGETQVELVWPVLGHEGLLWLSIAGTQRCAAGTSWVGCQATGNDAGCLGIVLEQAL